jgi:hypothetical protein
MSLSKSTSYSYQSSTTKNDGSWEVLHSVPLSEGQTGYRKCLSLKSYTRRTDEEPLFMADIRAYLKDKPTRVGICLTPFEFNWLVSHLTFKEKEDQEYRSPRSTRSLLITTKGKRAGGVKIVQEVEDQVRVLNLFKREITKIVRNYGDFLHLIEEMEEKELEEETEAETTDTEEKSEGEASEEKMLEVEPSKAETDTTL